MLFSSLFVFLLHKQLCLVIVVLQFGYNDDYVFTFLPEKKLGRKFLHRIVGHLNLKVRDPVAYRNFAFGTYFLCCFGYANFRAAVFASADHAWKLRLPD